MNQETIRRLAIMFTDLVGYSSMMGADERRAINQLQNYRSILRPIIESKEGVVIEYAGDSVFARFDNAVAAVEAGLEIQQALQQYNDRHTQQLRARIGIHVGDVLEKDGAIYGDDINIAARLEPLGDPRGVCISEAVYRELATSRKENCISYGRPPLKNINDRPEVFHLFPGPVSNGKRRQLRLRRIKRYLLDRPAVSLPLTFSVLALGIYLVAPLASDPGPAVHHVELGEIRNLNPHELPEYYTIGIADEIRTRLRGVPNLYLSTADNGVGADVILTGSLQKNADLVRISYRITRRGSDRIIGDASLDGSLEDMLSLQQQLANKVAVNLAEEFDLTLVSAKKARQRIDPEAYQYYLQAREYAKRPDDPRTLNSSIALYRKAVQTDADFAVAYAGLCDAYWGMYLLERQRERVDQAEQACLKAEALDTELSEVQVALGEIYKGRGRLAESVDAYNKAIQLEPRNSEAFVGLADVYTTLNKPDLAEQTYKRALGLQPGNWEAWQNYGHYQFSTGQFARAERSFRKVVTLTPDNVDAYSSLGAALLYRGDFKQAALVFDKQAELRPSASILSNAATMYYYDGDFEHAARLYKKAINLEPQQCLYWANLGDALHQLASRTDYARTSDGRALDLCSRELEVNPEDHQVLLVKSRLLARQNRIAEALELVEIYQSLDSRDPDDQLNLALVLIQCGDMDGAKRALEEAVQQGYPAILLAAEPGLRPLGDLAWFRSLLDGNRLH